MPSPDAGVRRARAGVSLMFFTNGVLLAALLPRYPEIKSSLGLDDGDFGLLVVTFASGALIAAGAGGPVVRRFGTLTVTAAGSVLLAAAFALAGATSTAWIFGAGLFAAGALDAVVDAAQNIHGVLVEDWRGRSTINSLHALWSLGAATGGAIGAAASSLRIDIAVQMVANGVVWSVVAIGASWLARVPGHVGTPSGAGVSTVHPGGAAAPSLGRAARRHGLTLLVPIVALAVFGTLVEDAANNWAVLFLRRETDAPYAVAGLGLTVALGAQFVGRVVGDPMTDRWGRDAVARAGGILIALGALLALLSPAWPLVLLGFAGSGFGSATLVPAAFAAAGRLPGLPEGTGIALLGWLMRIGFLVTSPLIGFIAEQSSLRVAWLLPVVAGVAAAWLAHRATARTLRDREPSVAG